MNAHRQIPYDKATELLRRPGYRLMQMKNNNAKHGHDFYIVPGGAISEENARKILEHPYCRKFDDGLFPGNPQSWTLCITASGNELAAQLATGPMQLHPSGGKK